jgi:hypothetical protein
LPTVFLFQNTPDIQFKGRKFKGRRGAADSIFNDNRGNVKGEKINGCVPNFRQETAGIFETPAVCQKIGTNPKSTRLADPEIFGRG